MAIAIVPTTSFSAKAEKKPWTAPAIQGLDLRSAQGSVAGTHNDKFGSISKS
jgi:hypothetical protein